MSEIALTPATLFLVQGWKICKMQSKKEERVLVKNMVDQNLPMNKSV